ncbi:MAG TPA: DUF58 domain-containing protein [Candidatus Brocadiia bacterium]|nr:DUF58 domain-containing protein [Candidatus Brocadiia bacterium]
MGKTETAETYLRPEIIQKVSRLDLRARFIVQGFLAGLHSSPYQGFSSEFSEHRRYAVGDDIKDLDWNVYARTDRYYIKRFHAETNMRCYLVLDASESMAYTYRQEFTKLDYAICLAASIGYLMVHQQDAVGLVTFDEEPTGFLPAKSKLKHLSDILGMLARAHRHRKTNLPKALHNVAEIIPKRSMVMIFTDLLAEPEAVIESLHHVRYRGHDVIIFQVLDEAEAGFPFSRLTRFVDPETGEHLDVDALAIRDSYLEEMRRFVEHYRRKCYEARIDFVQVDTSMSFDRALLPYLASRKARF